MADYSGYYYSKCDGCGAGSESGWKAIDHKPGCRTEVEWLRDEAKRLERRWEELRAEEMASGRFEVMDDETLAGEVDRLFSEVREAQRAVSRLRYDEQRARDALSKRGWK